MVIRCLARWAVSIVLLARLIPICAPAKAVAATRAQEGEVAAVTRADESEVARLESLATSDLDKARAEAEALRASITERIRTYTEFAEKSAEQERQWRELAESARQMAAEAEATARKYLDWSRDPLLSEEQQAAYRRSAEQKLRDAATDRERAAERERRAADRRADAEALYDQIAVLRDLDARLQAIVGEEPVPGTTEPPPAEGMPAEGGEAPETEVGEEEGVPLEFGLHDVLGLWQSVDGPQFTMAIVQEDPESGSNRYRLEGHTDRGAWKGKFTSLPPNDPGRFQNARVVMTYTPTAEEMNPEIPEWARRAVEGQLVWRLEMDEAGDLLSPVLRVKWFRGEVRWTAGEGERQAELAGDGVPRIIELEPIASVTVEELSRPVLGIRLPAPEHDPDKDPIEALLKGQPFFVRVTMPADLARERGNSLSVTIQGRSGGSSTTLELTSAGPAGNRPAVYSHSEAVAIADCDIYSNPPRNPQFMSMAWLFSAEGPCLDLEVEDGEQVEFSYDGAFQRVIVHDTWVQRGLAQHAEALERLTGVYNGILTAPHDAAVKEKAHDRLRMLTNLRHLLESPDFTDLHKFALGNLYLGDSGGPADFIGGPGEECGMVPPNGQFGLILQSDEELRSLYSLAVRCPANLTVDPGYFNPLMKAFLEGLTGSEVKIRAPDRADEVVVVWTGEAERFFVRKTLRHTSAQLLGKVVRTAVDKFAFGLWDGYVGSTAAGNLYLVVSGKDHFGRPVPTWERVITAVGLASEAVLEIASPSVARRFGEPPVQRSRLGVGSVRRSMIHGDAGAGLRILDGVSEVPGAPGRLSAAQRHQLALPLEAGPPSSGRCPCVRRPGGAPRSLTRPPSRPDEVLGVDPNEVAEARNYVAKAYPNGSVLLGADADPILPKQSPGRSTCNALSSAYMVYRGTGQKVSELEAVDRVRRIKMDQLWFEAPGLRKRRSDHGARTIDNLINGAGEVGGTGFDNFAIRDFLRSFGAQVAEVSKIWNWSVNVRHIWSALEKGYMIKIGVRLNPAHFGPRAFHAVVIDGLRVARRADGKLVVRAVRVYDSNAGRLIEVPAKAFDRMIAREITEFGIMTVAKFGNP